MNSINTYLKYFLALQMRERVLALVAAIGVMYFALDLAWIRPNAAEAAKLRAQVTQQDKEIETLKLALAALPVSNEDPLTATRAQRDQLRATVDEADTALGQAAGDLRMNDLIRGLVSTSPGVTVVSLRTLPSQTLFKADPASQAAVAASAAKALVASGAKAAASAALADQAPPAPALPPIYKHGVELTLRGQYVTLIPYVRALQQRSRGMFWGDLRLDTAAYPEATLRLTLYTLSYQPEMSL